MCKFCEFKKNELGYTGDVWYETDDAGDICGELCIMSHGYRSFWLCTPDYYKDRSGKKIRCCPMIARIRYCPMCGRNLLEDDELERLRSMVKMLDEKGFKTLKELVSGK